MSFARLWQCPMMQHCYWEFKYVLADQDFDKNNKQIKNKRQSNGINRSIQNQIVSLAKKIGIRSRVTCAQGQS